MSNTSDNNTQAGALHTGEDSFYMDPVLYTGRPADCTGRLEKEIRTYDLLDELQIPYWRLDHDATATIDACHDVDVRLDIEICKNLFLCNRQKTAFYLLTMPGGKPFQTKVLSAQLGTTRLSFAPPELMESMLRCTPGSASVLGLAYDTERRVRLVMDRAVHDAAWFGCHPCKNDASLRLRTEDLLHVFLPHTGHDVTVVDL